MSYLDTFLKSSSGTAKNTTNSNSNIAKFLGTTNKEPAFSSKTMGSGAYLDAQGNLKFPPQTKVPLDQNLKLSPSTVNSTEADIFGNPIKNVKDKGSLFGSIAKDIISGFGKALQFFGQEPAKFGASTQISKPFTPTSNLEKFVLGDETIKPIGQQYSETNKAIEPTYGKIASPIIAGTAIFGGGALNLLPVGGEKKLAEKLLAENTIEKTANILRKIGIGEDLIKPYAEKFANAKTAEEIQKGMLSLNTILETTAKPALYNSEKYVQELTNASKLASESQKTPGIINNTSNFLAEVKTKLVDSNAPIEDVLAKVQKEGKYTILPENHITNQIDRVLRSPTIAGQFAKDNGLYDIIKNVDNLNNLDQYLIAKQAKTVASRGIETGRNLVKDAQLVKDFAPKYEAQAKVITDYSQKLLDYSVDSGLISKDLANTLKQRYPDYVPLQRVFNELEKSGGNFGTKAVASLSKQTVIKNLSGSERQIESPIKSLLEKTADVFKQGEKNKAGQMLASYEKLPGNPFALRELKAGEHAINTISFIDNGVKRTFETTKEIADAAKALNVQQLNILGKIFALPVRIAKVGITGINLPFVASNIAKDQITGVINSSNALKTSIANPAVFLKSLFEAVGHGKLYDEMARNGALGTSFDIARNQATETIERVRAGKNIGSKILYTIKHPSELLRAVEDIIGRSEELTRIQQYAGTKQALLEKGLNEVQATIGASRAARENTVNFARKGEWGQVLNSAFLYLNAGIQGTRTFVRNFKEKPAQTAVKLALTVFTPIATVTAWNLSDPQRKLAYDDIAEYEKQNNIIIIPPNPTKDENGNWNVIKIPLSQEINNLAGMARRPIEQAFGLDPVSVQDIAVALIGTVSPINPSVGSIASTLTPQAIKPSIEALTNKNLFTGFNQVPQSMEGLSPKNQIKPTTSGTAIKIAQPLNLSPIKVEEFIKGTMGGVGSQILNASDRILAGLNIIPKDQIGGTDTLKAILARFATARGGNLDEKSNIQLQGLIQNQADESFRLKQEAEILYTELKALPKDQANTMASELQQKNPQLFDKLKTVVEADKKGLDYNDRLMMQLQVTNGERAKFIWENLKAFKTPEEKNSYLADLKKKGIVSANVMTQLQELKAKGY